MSLDVYEDEPRTAFDLIRDLADQVREREWVEEYERCGRGCCGEWVKVCPDCGGKEPGTADGRYKRKEGHQDGCRLHALLTEAEAMLAAEEARREAEEAERERQHSGKTSWEHLEEAQP